MLVDPGKGTDEFIDDYKKFVDFEEATRAIENFDEFFEKCPYQLPSIIKARQTFVVDIGACAKVRAISSVDKVNEQAPLVQFVKKLAAATESSANACQVHQIGDELVKSLKSQFARLQYPFEDWLWVPLLDGKRRLKAAIFLVRKGEWSERELRLATRISSVYSQCLRCLTAAPRSRLPQLSGSWKLGLTLAAILGLGIVRVPMTVLAPAEIVAKKPTVITAPIAGVIDAIPVASNDMVEAGTEIVHFNDIELRSQFELAEQAVQIAHARLQQINQMALFDAGASRELAIAEAELALKKAERDHARERLDLAVIKAPRDGVAVYADPSLIEGRSFATGEEILRIADPARLEVMIEVAVEDSIALELGAPVRLFLNNDPLNIVNATVSYTAFQPEASMRSARLVYKVRAELNIPESGDLNSDAPGDHEVSAGLRIGYRGTAQLLGDEVSLYFYVFRRPLTYLRQNFGF